MTQTLLILLILITCALFVTALLFNNVMRAINKITGNMQIPEIILIKQAVASLWILDAAIAVVIVIQLLR